MIGHIYRKDNIELMYDIEEDVFYIRVGSGDIVCCTQDYTKEEIISILKDMIKTLNVWLKNDIHSIFK